MTNKIGLKKICCCYLFFPIYFGHLVMEFVEGYDQVIIFECNFCVSNLCKSLLKTMYEKFTLSSMDGLHLAFS